MNPETPAKHKVGGDMYLFLGIKFRFLFDFIFRNFADSSIIEISRELIFATTADQKNWDAWILKQDKKCIIQEYIG